MATHAKKRSAGKIIGIILGVVVALLLVLVVGANLFVRIAYAPFYAQAEEAFDTPGIHAGFIPQDLDYYDLADAWLFSGYMGGEDVSPLWRRDANGTDHEILLAYPDGTLYADHGAGVTSTDEHIYVTCANGYLIFGAQDLMAAESGQVVKALEQVDLEFTPAFLNIEEDTLYAGDFYYPGTYETPAEHWIATSDGGQNPAVMYAYLADPASSTGFAQQADHVYSIPDQVQGMCTIDDQIVLSRSYGLASSHLSVYPQHDLSPIGTFKADGNEVPLYQLDDAAMAQNVEAPPMTEGIEDHDGLIYIANESASNKYIFGKLYGGGMVYAYDLDCLSSLA